MADEDERSLMGFIQLIFERPFVSICLVIALIGLLVLLFGLLQVQTSFPYITGTRNIKEDWPYPLIGSILILVSLSLIVIYTRKTKESSLINSKDDEFISKFPMTDQDGFKAIFHYKCSEKIDYIDKDHLYSNIKIMSIVDEKGNYYGIYERKGVVREKKCSDGIVVHASASSVGVYFGDLHILAFDLEEQVLLRTELIDEANRCKIWKIYFRSPKSSGQYFNIRWYFTWPRAMAIAEDFDAMNLGVLKYKSGRAEISMYLPMEPAICQGWTFLSGKNKQNILSSRKFDKSLGIFNISLNKENIDELNGLLLYYKSMGNSAIIYPILNAVKIVRATPEDLKDVYMLEIASEVKNMNASLSVLHDRLSMNPAGFLVAKIGDYILGYIETCRWNRTQYSTFNELSNFRDQHIEDGRFCYIIFMSVAEPFRNMGIGRKLIQAIIDKSRISEVEEIHLVSKNEVVQFYEKIGFNKIQNLPNFLSNTKTVLMKKFLR